MIKLILWNFLAKIKDYIVRRENVSIQVKEKDFEEIYQRTYLNTFKFITIHCYDVADINDILQDTYVEFYKILCKKRTLEMEKIQNYIYGIANIHFKGIIQSSRTLTNTIEY